MQLLKMLETALVYVVLCISLESSKCFRLNNERAEVILNKRCVRENRTVHISPPVSYSPSFSHSFIPSLSPLGNCKSSGWGGHGSWWSQTGLVEPVALASLSGFASITMAMPLLVCCNYPTTRRPNAGGKALCPYIQNNQTDFPQVRLNLQLTSDLASLAHLSVYRNTWLSGLSREFLQIAENAIRVTAPSQLEQAERDSNRHESREAKDRSR